MTRDAAITIRLPAALKRRLEARAASQHRSVSAQVVAELELVLESSGGPMKGSFLGRYKGTRLPSDEDLEGARDLLWGRLARRSERA